GNVGGESDRVQMREILLPLGEGTRPVSAVGDVGFHTANSLSVMSVKSVSREDAVLMRRKSNVVSGRSQCSKKMAASCRRPASGAASSADKRCFHIAPSAMSAVNLRKLSAAR